MLKGEKWLELIWFLTLRGVYYILEIGLIKGKLHLSIYFFENSELSIKGITFGSKSRVWDSHR